jgi:FkbM family methyltransferase
VIDIGAHTGEWAASICGYLRPRTTYAFEPLASCLPALRSRGRTIGGLHVFNVALADRSGREEFFENSYGPSASLLHVSHIHKTEFPETARETPTAVEVARLDDVLDADSLEKNVFIKVDVQGVEDRVIRGGRRVFGVARCVLIEMAFVEMYEGQPLFEEVHALLVELGFRFAGVKNQIDSSASKQPLFAHCFYVRADRPAVVRPLEPRLSVVVGTLNRREQVQACIESIFQQTRIPVRVYVTDAGSTDGTIPYLESISSDRLVPIFEGRRLGQARAYNAVFDLIDSPYVCWLSDDNLVVDGGLDRAVQILEENGRIGMVALKVKDVRGPFVDAPYIGGVSEIGILNVNQGVLRTPVLKAVGGFSEAFRDYGIDPDLTAKVLFSGHSVAYTREVAVHHHRNWATDPASDAYGKLAERQKAYLELYRRKYGPIAKRDLAWTIKRGLFAQLVRRLGWQGRLNSTRPVLGLIPRDWHNVLTSRYISVLDPLFSRGRPFHLVQYCPPGKRPPSLPPDPKPVGGLLGPVESVEGAR